MSEYRFYLKPFDDLPSSATLEFTYITSNISLDTSGGCSSSIGTCTFGSNKITVIDPYPSGYTSSSSSAYTAFDITGIINPNANYTYGNIQFNITAKNGLMGPVLLIRNNMPLTSAYVPHFYESPSIVGDSYNLFETTSYTISFINKDYAIPNGYYLRIQFSTSYNMRFVNTPTINVISGLSASPSITSGSSSYRTIRFNGGVAANTNIEFKISNIQNANRMYTNIFTVYIFASSSSYLYYKSQSTDFQVTIDGIPEFGLFQINPNSKTVSMLTEYQVKIIVGTVIRISYNDYILLTVPSAIKYCKNETIAMVSGCSTSNIFYKRIYSSYAYIFRTPCCCYNNEGNTIRFNITCQNPETMMPTENFTIQALSCSSSSCAYYQSVGAPVTMQNMNTLSVSLSLSNKWVETPNTLTLTVQKTSSNVSSDIDQLIITLSPQLTILSCLNVINEVGIIPLTPSMSCSGQVITLTGILTLQETFELAIPNIKNPTSTTSPIYVSLTTGNTGGYLGESGTSGTHYTNCEFPCLSCSASNISNCSTCYTENNAVFGVGTSYHIHYTITHTDESSCVNICPIHTFNATASSCADCDPICEECADTATKCTKCYPNTFLHPVLEECVSSTCPPGYSDNIDDWTCVEIKSFEPGSSISIVDNEEVELPAKYKFILLPQITLSAAARLEITSPPELGVNVTCISSLGDCAIISPSSVLVLENFLSVAFIGGGGAEIVFEIENTYVNPRYTRLYSAMEFTVESKVGAVIYHSGRISISGPAGRYQPHILGSCSINTNNTTTVSYATVTFNLTNTGFKVQSNYNLLVTFPSQMAFGNISPTFTPLQNLDNTASITIAYPYINVSNIFTTQLMENSLISFSINNLLNPYKIGITNSFIVQIIPTSGGGVFVRQFEKDTGMEINILDIAPFSTFSVIPNNLMTSEPAIYLFDITLGDGKMNANDKILFKPPISVTNCSDTSITEVTHPIQSRAYDLATNIYSFEIQNIIEEGTLIRFSVECNNPESTFPTDNFLIQGVALNGDKYYESEGNPVTMTLLNNFGNIAVTMADERPLVQNIFTFTLTRTADYPSRQINRIKILRPSSMETTSCVLGTFTGVTFGVPQLVIMPSGHLQINGIIELDRTFSIEIINMQNPPLTTDNIQFTVVTILFMTPDTYKSEEAFTNTLNTKCNFPCETCQIGIPNSCLSCFPPDHHVYDSNIQEYLYMSDTKECLSSCPTHYYENIPTFCDICAPICSECNLAQTNCTACYPNTYLLNQTISDNQCISSPCPPHYYQNAIDWMCERNISYI